LASYWAEACADSKVVGQEDELTLDEWAVAYPGLTPDSACNWEVVGLDPQDALTLAGTLQDFAFRIRQLISIVFYYRSLDPPEIDNPNN